MGSIEALILLSNTEPSWFADRIGGSVNESIWTRAQEAVIRVNAARRAVTVVLTGETFVLHWKLLDFILLLH